MQAHALKKDMLPVYEHALSRRHGNLPDADTEGNPVRFPFPVHQGKGQLVQVRFLRRPKLCLRHQDFHSSIVCLCLPFLLPVTQSCTHRPAGKPCIDNNPSVFSFHAGMYDNLFFIQMELFRLDPPDRSVNTGSAVPTVGRRSRIIHPDLNPVLPFPDKLRDIQAEGAVAVFMASRFFSVHPYRTVFIDSAEIQKAADAFPLLLQRQRLSVPPSHGAASPAENFCCFHRSMRIPSRP